MATSIRTLDSVGGYRLVHANTFIGKYKIIYTDVECLREIARDFLSEELLRCRKYGFNVPLDAWFRGGARSS